MIILTSDNKLASEFPFLTSYKNWLTSVIILTAEKNWLHNVVLKSRGTTEGTTTLLMTTTAAYRKEDIDLKTDLKIEAFMKKRISK